MNRREFVYGAASTAFAAMHEPGSDKPVAIQLQQPGKNAPMMPIDFVGLSYEGGQLYNPDFFSPQNTPLVKTFLGLSNHGVLRIGGHLSNITTWEGAGQNEPKQIRGVRHGIEDYWEWPLVDPKVQQNKHGIITRKTLRNLRGFLDATNWRLMYGMNFACGSAARAADEAAAVTEVIGDRVIAFVIGNEPDGFGDDPFFRAKGYDVHQYLDEYETWVKTIRARTPRAQFAGPDTDGKVDTWVMEFAKRTKGDAKLLTSHFYGMGPASDPSMTAEKLLRKTHADLDAQIAAVHAARAAAGGTPYRMDEGNSCFGGGRKDVSDAYASALWAADYLLKAAGAGFVGVNLHGGGVGVYTPIESSTQSPASPRAVYYGMQFAQQFAGYRISPCPLQTPANITAYQGSKNGQMLLALINKGGKPVAVKLPEKFATASKWELTGPALKAKTGVRFGSAPALTTTTLQVNAYSSVILRVG